MLNPRTHSPTLPDSYYAATRRYEPQFPALEGDHHYDVCVVGAGYSGINTAIELQQRGYRVAVVDRFQVGWGASGRNGGQLIRGIGHGLEQFRKEIGEEGIQALAHMGFEAVDIVKQRIADFDIQCDLKLGYCDLANRKRHLRDFEEEKAWLDRVGYPHETELLEQSEMHQVVGSDRYVGGLIDRGSGHLHPLNLIHGEALAAAYLGVHIFEHSPVIRIDEGDTCTVITDRGRIECNTLVLCANAYVQGLNSTLESKVLPAGSYIIATEPLPEDIHTRVLPQDMAVCDQRVALDYYRLSADKRLLFGGRCNYSGRDPKHIAATMRPDMLKVFPYLEDVKIEFEWGGMIGIGANRLPQVGRLKPNVYFAQAYAGHGVNASHMAARLIAESIHGETERIRHLEAVRHMRFPGGHRFRSPLLALGMSYYRLLDLF